MFVKVYRYHIRSEKTEEFLDIQERAGKIYRRHVSYRAVYLKSQDDPGLCLEIQWCADEDTYRSAMERINSEPGIKELWQEFQILLDPEKPDIQEECFNQIRSEGDSPLI
ncbi:MAG: hypothetical protein WBE28_08555 [bacterium]